MPRTGGNPDIAKYARAKRRVYPASVEERVSPMEELLERQLQANGTTIETLYELIGDDARTTLVNRIHKGTLSMKDLLWITDYVPISIDSIIAQLREPKQPTVKPEPIDEDVDTEEWSGMFPSLGRA